MGVNLHAVVAGDGPDVILIHGLFGMGSNLGTIARSLQDRFRVHSIDLPNHGRSDWLAVADIPKMAEAVLSWLDQQGLQSVRILGHSLGGKVAMELALRHPQRVEVLVAADIAPVAYGFHHENEFAALEAVANSECRSRAEAAQVMKEYLQEEAVIQFLLKNLNRNSDGSYGWRFNLEEIVSNYEFIRAAISPGASFDKPVLFIKGELSNYIQEQHKDSILALFPKATLKVMPGCGHWLHAENPRLFNALAGRFFDDQG